MNITQEQTKKAMNAKSAEEILAIAKAEGIEMTEDEAKRVFTVLHKEGSLSDDELDAIAGGKGELDVKDYHCIICGGDLVYNSYLCSGYDSAGHYYLHYGCTKCFSRYLYFPNDRIWKEDDLVD